MRAGCWAGVKSGAGEAAEREGAAGLWRLTCGAQLAAHRECGDARAVESERESVGSLGLWEKGVGLVPVLGWVLGLVGFGVLVSFLFLTQLKSKELKLI